MVIISSLLVPCGYCQETEDSQIFIAGFNAYQQKDFPSAIEKMSEVLQKFPDSPLRDMALFWLSRSNYKIGNQREAARIMSQFSKEYPDNPLKGTIEEELLALVARYEKGETLPTVQVPAGQAERKAAELKARAEKERQAALKAEEERTAAERERLAREKAEQERTAREKAEKLEQERLAALKAEQERLAALKAEEERKAAEAARQAALKAEQERTAAEAARQAALKAEQERAAAEVARLAALKAEEDRLAAEKAVQERIAREKAEQERLAALKAEEARKAAERAEQERIAGEKLEAERQAALKAEQERIAAEAARLTAEKAEQERLAAEKAEQQRLAALKAEEERVAREKAEQQRIAAIRDEEQRLAALKAEEERKAAEAQRLADLKAAEERAAAEKAQQERLAAEKAEQERTAAEAARLAAEKAEEERKAAEKAEQERIAALKAEEERVAREKVEQERTAAEAAEQQLLAALKEESDRLAKAQAEQQLLAAQKAEEERIARARAEQERIARARAEEERLLAVLKVEEARKAAEKVEQERQAALAAEQQRLTARKAEEERQAAEAIRHAAVKAEQERIAREQAEQERQAGLKAEEERKAAEKAEQQRLAGLKAEEERKAAAKAALREKAVAQYKSIIETYPGTRAATAAAVKLKELGIAVALPAQAAAEVLPENTQVLRLEVAQYAGFEFNLLPGQQAYEVARRISVPFEVVNRGNGTDSFNLESSFPAVFGASFAAASAPDAPISQTPQIGPGETFRGVVTLAIPAGSIDGLRITHPVKAVSRFMPEATQSREIRLIASAPLLRAIVKSDRNQSLPGEKIAYRVALLNVGSTAAQDVTFRLNHPPQLEAVDPAASGLRQEKGETLVLEGLQLNSGESREFTVTFRLKDDTLAGQELLTRAELLDRKLKTTAVFVSNVALVQAQHGILVRAGSERLTVIPGQTMSVPFVVTNTGNVREKFRIASGTDGVQQAVVFHDMNRDGIRQASEPVVTEIGPLAPKEEASVVIEVATPRSAADRSEGGVRISFTSEGDPQRQASGSARLFFSRPVLQMAMAARDGKLKPGEVAAFDLTISNNGSNIARVVELNSVWPEQLELVASEPNVTSSTGGAMTWKFKELGAGEKRTIKVSFRVKAGTGVGTNIQVRNVLTYEDQQGNRY